MTGKQCDNEAAKHQCSVCLIRALGDPLTAALRYTLCLILEPFTFSLKCIQWLCVLEISVRESQKREVFFLSLSAECYQLHMLPLVVLYSVKQIKSYEQTALLLIEKKCKNHYLSQRFPVWIADASFIQTQCACRMRVSSLTKIFWEPHD